MTTYSLYNESKSPKCLSTTFPTRMSVHFSILIFRLNRILMKKNPLWYNNFFFISKKKESIDSVTKTIHHGTCAMGNEKHNLKERKHKKNYFCPWSDPT